MQKRNRLYVTIGPIGGRLALVRLIARTLMLGNARGAPIVTAARNRGGYRP